MAETADSADRPLASVSEGLILLPEAPPAEQRVGLSVHSARGQSWHLIGLAAFALLLAAPSWMAFDGEYRGTLDLHAAMKSAGALVGMAAGLTLVMRYFQLGRNRFHLFVGLAFLVNGAADLFQGALCFRGLFPVSERDEDMCRFLAWAYVRSEFLLAASLLVALLLPIRGERGGRNRYAPSVLAASVCGLVLLWQMWEGRDHLRGDWRLVGLVDGLLLAAAAVVCGERYFAHREMFAWWLLVSVVCNLLGVAVLLLSREPLDALFDLAHAYKLLGYFAPLVGVLLHQAARERDYLVAQAELIAAREAALAGARAKAEFLANVSHELRTPMNAVLGLTLRALQNAEGERRVDLLSAHRSAEGLVRLLNDVLDFEKMEAGKVALTQAPFRLAEFAESVVEPLRWTLVEKGLTLTVDLGDDAHAVLVGDESRLRQVLVNLLGNAAKFTERGSVALTARVADADGETYLRCAVRDTGVGIPADMQRNIFDAFVQADGSTTRRFGGTGLGLAICVRLVELMGGKIDVVSEPGVGSEFSFEAKVRRATAHEAAELPTALPTTHGIPKTAHPKRVLLAEDNALNRRVAEGLLADMGHHATTCVGGREFLLRLREDGEGYDVGLLDLQMPELGGLEVARIVRDAEKATGRTPLFLAALTAHALDADRVRCMQAGMDDYLTKPIDAARLFAAIENAPGRRPPFDRAAFWKQMAGHRSLADEIVALFRRDTPATLASLQSAVENVNAVDAAEHAHKLAGSLANLHAAEARRLAREIETTAAHDDWERARHSLERLHREIARLDAALSNLGDAPAA